MNIRTRTILVNLSLAVGLVVMFYRGAGLLPVVITGVLFFIFANVLLAVKRRS
jgi:hypothetical protein